MVSWVEKLLVDLQKFVYTYNATVQGCCCSFGKADINYFVAVCTPLVARVHTKVPQAAEVLLVDASGEWTDRNTEYACLSR